MSASALQNSWVNASGSGSNVSASSASATNPPEVLFTYASSDSEYNLPAMGSPPTNIIPLVSAFAAKTEIRGVLIIATVNVQGVNESGTLQITINGSIAVGRAAEEVVCSATFNVPTGTESLNGTVQLFGNTAIQADSSWMFNLSASIANGAGEGVITGVGVQIIDFPIVLTPKSQSFRSLMTPTVQSFRSLMSPISS